MESSSSQYVSHFFLSLMFFLSPLLSWSEAPPKVARTCTACHGEKGVTPNSIWPNLAGQNRDYLIKQLTDFKMGKRQDPLMTPYAKVLSKEEIQNLASYFSSLKCK